MSHSFLIYHLPCHQGCCFKLILSQHSSFSSLLDKIQTHQHRVKIFFYLTPTFWFLKSGFGLNTKGSVIILASRDDLTLYLCLVHINYMKVYGICYNNYWKPQMLMKPREQIKWRIKHKAKINELEHKFQICLQDWGFWNK